MEFNFSIQYRPERVPQVPDALPRLLLPKFSAEAKEPIDDDVPAFKIVNVVKPLSPGSKIFVTK